MEQADVIIAEASYPSTGMGIELQIAEHEGIPVIICFKSAPEHQIPPVEYNNPDSSKHKLQIGEGYVTLMALGLPNVFQVIAYEEDTQGIAMIVEAVRLLKRR